MFDFQVSRKFYLAVVTAGLLAVAGCSNQQQATNQPPAAAKKPAVAKPAAAKAQPAASQKTGSATNVNVAVKSGSAKSPSAKPVSSTTAVAPTTALVTVPKGTSISATIGQVLASNKNHAGDTFKATLTSSVKVNGKTVIPKGAHITGQVVTAKKKGTPELTLALASVELHGKTYHLATNAVAPATANSGDDSDAAKSKAVTVAASSHMKFKLTKSVKLPIKS